MYPLFCIGKSSLKKTIYGECYNPKSKPTLGIDADPSITRITFKQYKEWVLQNASKADTRRLNLEYIDIIIDYVLNSLQQPWVSDDTFDIGTLHIEKDRVLKVDFNPSEIVIPEEPMFEEENDTADGERREGTLPNVDVTEDGNGEMAAAGGSTVLEVDSNLPPTSQEPDTINDDEIQGPIDNIMKITSNMETLTTNQGSSSGSSVLPGTSSSIQSGGASNRAGLKSSHPNRTKRPNVTQRTPHLSRLTSESTTCSSATSFGSRRGGNVTDEIIMPREYKPDRESFFRAKGELSRLLLEKIPREILKRMVIRWPVGDEPVVLSRAELNKERLMITVWDVSGDPLQHNFTPFFFSHRCLFVSMYNLTQQLDDPCESFAAKNLRGVDGCIPTNAEVLEDWLGYVTALSKPMPSIPFRCSNATPVLPPVIIACSFADKEEVKEHPVQFHKFFARESVSSYCKHLVEWNEPSALIISSKFENEGEETYAGHNLLRREIDHLARQMPFCSDNIPIQWVRFEQLIYGLQEQKKIILLYDDLTRYVAEHCDVSGTLQILPILSHFHEVGVISHYYRHPLLSNIIITKPQWLADALGSVIVSSPSKWVTTEVQVAFTKLSQEGIISKEMLLLAYRCGRMHQRYWNETLFILNCMDLICCHPACHKSESLYVPCLVTQPVPSTQSNSFADTSNSSSSLSSIVLHFSTGTAAFPIAVYNQFVVRCIHGCQYTPKLFYCTAHLRLNSSHHLIISKHHTFISIQIQYQHEQNCHHCCTMDKTPFPPSPNCSHIEHIMGEGVEYSSSDNIATLINLSTKLTPSNEPSLNFTDNHSSLTQLCPAVLAFSQHHLNFLTRCWFPGLRIDLVTYTDGVCVVLDQCWKHTVLTNQTVQPSLRVWFK